MKNKLSRLLCALLCMAMLLSLAACGNNGNGGKEPEATAAPEYVYSADYTLISKDDNYWPNVLLSTDEGIYIGINVKVGENIPEGAVVEYEGQYDVYEQQVFFMRFDGNGTMEKLEGFKAPEFIPEHEDGDGNFYLNSMMKVPGGFCAVLERYEYWSDAPAGVEKFSDEWYNYWASSESFYILQLAEDGSELSRSEIVFPEDVSDTYISYSAMGADGKLYCTTYGGLFVFSLDGVCESKIDTGDYWVDGLVTLADGSIALLWDAVNGRELAMIDTEAKAFGASYPLPANCWTVYTGGGEYDVYYTNGSNFYGYSLQDAKESKLFNWISCDVNPNDLNTVIIRKDGIITMLVCEWNNSYEKCEVSKVEISKKPYDPSTEKKVLTLATVWSSDALIEQVIRFNRHSSEYRIEVKDYSEYNTENDYSAGLTKLNTEIMAGNAPDIVDLSNLSYTALAGKGLLMDLYPLIDADPELSREDFFPTVLQAAEVGGKLCGTVGSFYINTCVGASSVVGDKQGWNYREFSEALASMPEGCDAFDYYTTRYDVLNSCLSTDMSSFVDRTTGECRFDSQAFIDLLEFTKQFRASFDWDNYDYSSEDDTWTRIKQGKQMLVNANLGSFDDLPYYSLYFGGDITFIGYPTESGNGSTLSLDSTRFGISAGTKYPDAAWEFVRVFFTEEYQDNLYGFRSNIHSFNKLMEAAMEQEYEKDENGNFRLDENGEKIPVPKGQYWFGDSDDAHITVYATTQEEADAVLALINSTTKCYSEMDEIYDIVQQEIEAFYSGQKSAAEVARLIQSKATIYINEQL